MTPDNICGPILKKRNNFSLPGDSNRIHDWNILLDIDKRTTKYNSGVIQYIEIIEKEVERLKKYERLYNIQRNSL